MRRASALSGESCPFCMSARTESGSSTARAMRNHLSRCAGESGGGFTPGRNGFAAGDAGSFDCRYCAFCSPNCAVAAATSGGRPAVAAALCGAGFAR